MEQIWIKHQYKVAQATLSGNGRAIVFGLYTQKNANAQLTARNVYLSYDPVVDIPFYDPEDFLDLL